MQKTVFEQVIELYWDALRADEDFATHYAELSRRDYKTLFATEVNVSAADCPYCAIRLALSDYSTWKDNARLAIPMTVEVEIGIAEEGQARAIQGHVAFVHATANQFIDRLHLPYIESIVIGSAAFKTQADVTPEMQLLGVIQAVNQRVTFNLARDARDKGLFA